jgi:hypothetical protein
MVKPDRSQTKIKGGACALQAGFYATDPHSEYVIFFALPRPKF